MKPKLLLVDDITQKAKDKLAPFVEFVYPGDGDYSHNFTVVYTGLTPIVTNAPVFCPCTGVDHVISPKIIYLNDDFKKFHSKNVTSTAEHTISLILQLLKLNKMQIYRKNIAIVGYGRIGKLVKKMLSGFDCFVKCFDKNENWINQLKSFDIITFHIPLEKNTEEIIDKNIIYKMKDNALIINTSRSRIMNEFDLIESLKNGKLLGYAHDFNPNQNTDSKKRIDLWKYSNINHKVIATNHIGGNCIEAREITDMFIAKKIIEYIKNEVI